MKKLIYTALLLFGAINLIAQSNMGTLKGKVTEEGTNSPIPFAIVSVQVGGEKIGASTDLDGKFTIKPLSPGTYNVEITSSEYNTAIVNGVAINGDKITFLNDITMTQGNMLKGFTIKVWRKKLIDPEDTKIQTISAKDIVVLPVRTNINKIAQTMSSEISVSEDGNEIYFRGSRNGDVIYFIDGVKITGGRPLIPSAGIQAMRIYTGGIPAKYGDMMGGVIMVETKSYFDYYNAWKAKQEMEEYKK